MSEANKAKETTKPNEQTEAIYEDSANDQKY